MLEDNFIPEGMYGYVPFKYFQHMILLIILILILLRKYIYGFLNKYIYSKISNLLIKKYIKIIVALIPIYIMVYYDINYSSFSMKNLGVTKYISNLHLNAILRLIGSYCIVQSSGLSLGLFIGDTQNIINKEMIIQFLLFFTAAFAYTNNRSESLFAAISYFLIKYLACDKTIDINDKSIDENNDDLNNAGIYFNL